MNEFGWSYPPGAENDPNAPYNQVDPPEVEVEDCTPGVDLECPVCEGNALWCDNCVSCSSASYNPTQEFTGWHCDNCGWRQEDIK